jgi:arylsulfatase A-like enzyme
MISSRRSLLILLLAGVIVNCQPRPKPSQWNVVWISIDDVKAASLGCYGRQRDTSPNLDALARKGVRFDWCVSQSSWSLPSYVSALTSRYPYETVLTREYLRHLRGETEIARSRDPYRMPKMNQHWFGKLAPEIPTAAEVFSRAGFRTAAWTNNKWLAPELSGLDRGFSEYVYTTKADALVPPASETMPKVAAWVEQHRGERFFLFIHLMDPHEPWHPHPEFGFGSRPLDRYEAEIRTADQWIGTFFSKLRQLKLMDRTVVVVSSDHGEGIYEENERFVGHGGGVIQDLIRVPLIISGPGLPRGKVVKRTVRKLDIFPTLLDLVGLPAPPELRGKSLVPLWSGKPAPGPEDYLPAVTMGMIKGPEQISVVTGRWQVVLVPAYGSVQVFPWSSEESPDLILRTQDQAAAAAEKFLSEMLADLDRRPLPSPVNIDPETEKKLKALGYLR